MSLKSASIFTVFLFLAPTGGFDHGRRAENQQFPYSALIYPRTSNNTDDVICSGAIVSDQLVMTTGRCIEGAETFRIKLGAINGGSDYKLEYDYDHVMQAIPKYSYLKKLALIKLSPKCTFTRHIQPVTLPSNVLRQPKYVNKSAIVAGWCGNRDDSQQLELQWLPVEIFSETDYGLYPTVNTTNNKLEYLSVNHGALLVIESSTLIGIAAPYITQMFLKISWFSDWIESEIRAETKNFPYSALIVVNINLTEYYGFRNATNNEYVEKSCSGALISTQRVITAGICVVGAKTFRIKLGPKNVGTPTDYKWEYEYDHNISTVPIHSLDRELVMIPLSPNCNFNSHVQPINFPPADRPYATNVNDSAIVVGWVSNYKKQLELQWLPVRVVEDGYCSPKLHFYNNNTSLCAQNDDDKIDGKLSNLCGSLGSALVDEKNVLIGISIIPCQGVGPGEFARIKWFNDWSKWRQWNDKRKY